MRIPEPPLDSKTRERFREMIEIGLRSENGDDVTSYAASAVKHADWLEEVPTRLRSFANAFGDGGENRQVDPSTSFYGFALAWTQGIVGHGKANTATQDTWFDRRRLSVARFQDVTDYQRDTRPDSQSTKPSQNSRNNQLAGPTWSDQSFRHQHARCADRNARWYRSASEYCCSRTAGHAQGSTHQ